MGLHHKRFFFVGVKNNPSQMERYTAVCFHVIIVLYLQFDGHLIHGKLDDPLIFKMTLSPMSSFVLKTFISLSDLWSPEKC